MILPLPQMHTNVQVRHRPVSVAYVSPSYLGFAAHPLPMSLAALHLPLVPPATIVLTLLDLDLRSRNAHITSHHTLVKYGSA